MKFNSKIFIFLSLVFCFLTITLISVSGMVEAAGQKAAVEASTTIKAAIPVYQELKILEKKDIDYSVLMENYNGGQQIVVKDALTVEVMSNASWNLSLNNRNLNSKVMIKESRQSDSEWQNLNLNKAKFSEGNGVQKISFDLKFILVQSSRAAVDNLELDLRHSLAAKMY